MGSCFAGFDAAITTLTVLNIEEGQTMTETSAQTQPVYSKYGDDPDLGELVEMFVDEMPGRLESLKSQFDSSDWDELKRTAHQLKGSAGSYGFDQLSPYAARLEATLLDGETEESIRESLDALVDICSRARSGAPIV